MTVLRKAEVERLLRDYDADPLAALTDALRIVLDAPTATWAELVRRAAFDDARRALLLAGDQSTLDGLAAELNEQRGVPPGNR
ncbi:MAG: hypothetical protein ACKOA2_09830 [Ilumatobacteraceae bacterium]